MYYQNDWLLRQIEMFFGGMSRMLFNKDAYSVADTNIIIRGDSYTMQQQILELLNQGKICEAEDFLFANFKPDNKAHLMIALDFYKRLNDFDDVYLEKHDFSREEILTGLKDVSDISGMGIRIDGEEESFYCF